MLEGILEDQPLLRLILEHPCDEVEHEALLVAPGSRWVVPPVLRQGPAVLGGVPGGRLVPVPGQSPAGLAEEGGLGPADGGGGQLSEDPGHHRQVLQVVVSLEQGVALIKLEDDTSYAPYIAGLTPPKLQNNFRRPVVPGTHHTAVMLPVKGCRPKVDQLDSCVSHASYCALRRRTVLAVPFAGDEQNVLRL